MCPMANGAAVHMLASASTLQNYLSILQTVPTTDQPTELKDMGYYFDDNWQLRRLADGAFCFAFIFSIEIRTLFQLFFPWVSAQSAMLMIQIFGFCVLLCSCSFLFVYCAGGKFVYINEALYQALGDIILHHIQTLMVSVSFDCSFCCFVCLLGCRKCSVVLLSGRFVYVCSLQVIYIMWYCCSFCLCNCVPACTSVCLLH